MANVKAFVLFVWFVATGFVGFAAVERMRKNIMSLSMAGLRCLKFESRPCYLG